MGKDFGEFVSQKQNISETQDQHIAVVNNDLNLYSQQFQIQLMTFISNFTKSILIAPMKTVQISLQLSPIQTQLINPLRAKPASFENLTKREKLINEFQMNGSIKPFDAQCFKSYNQAFSGLGSQGLKAFYKGNLINLINLSLDSIMKFQLIQLFKDYQQYSWQKQISILTAINLGLDIVLYPLMTMQSRFVLQNPNSNFRLYKSIGHFVRSNMNSPLQLYKGFILIIPQSVMLSVSYHYLLEKLKQKPELAYVYSHSLTLLINYPLNTIARRLQCQNGQITMLKTDYSGFIDGVKKIRAIEGVKGFYRGVCASLLTNVFGYLFILSNLQDNVSLDQL